MKVLIGIVLIVFLSLVTAFILYFFLLRQKPKRRIKPKARAKPRAALRGTTPQTPPAQAQTPTRHRYEIPPEIPRDIDTMKIIAQEDPKIITDMIRKWMKEK